MLFCCVEATNRATTMTLTTTTSTSLLWPHLLLLLTLYVVVVYKCWSESPGGNQDQHVSILRGWAMRNEYLMLVCFLLYFFCISSTVSILMQLDLIPLNLSRSLLLVRGEERMLAPCRRDDMVKLLRLMNSAHEKFIKINGCIKNHWWK